MIIMDRSLNGGKSFTYVRERPIGKGGNTTAGRSGAGWDGYRGSTYRFTLSEPVKPVIIALTAQLVGWKMPRLNPAQPIVRDDKTMELPFWSFLIEVDKQIPIVGKAAGPEGLVVAPVPVAVPGYRRRGRVGVLPQDAARYRGDKSQGWVKALCSQRQF